MALPGPERSASRARKYARGSGKITEKEIFYEKFEGEVHGEGLVLHAFLLLLK